jgi:type III restriction enzyme
MACNRITAGITRALEGKRPIKALLDPYNPIGSTAHVRFNTSRPERWETSSKSCHVNWIVLDSDWEAEFCRVAESHPKVRAYVKNHNLGLEVPYRYGSEIRKYLPDFIVLVDDGHGPDDLLHLVVEIKGYRREDAKEKKSTMDTYWVPGVNNLKQYGRWTFGEFTEIYQMETDFAAKVETEFAKMVESASGRQFSAFTVAKNRAERCLKQQFGDDPVLVEINETIWRAIQSRQPHALHLSDLVLHEQSASSKRRQTLGVLGLLSNPTVRALTIRFYAQDGRGREIFQTEITQKLTDWWRDNSISEADWREWASNIRVQWVPTLDVTTNA